MYPMCGIPDLSIILFDFRSSCQYDVSPPEAFLQQLLFFTKCLLISVRIWRLPMLFTKAGLDFVSNSRFRPLITGTLKNKTVIIIIHSFIYLILALFTCITVLKKLSRDAPEPEKQLPPVKPGSSPVKVTGWSVVFVRSIFCQGKPTETDPYIEINVRN